VLLIGHGTRDDLGTQEFFQLGKLLAERCSPLPVESALLEFQSPTIPEAWKALVGQGAAHVHVAPLLLFAAGHAKSDIPDIINQCRSSSQQITTDQARPLSRHPAIIQLATQRIQETLDFKDDVTPRTAVVMVGRGSHDPCASADMRVLSEITGKRLRLPTVWTAFYAMAQPRLPTVLREVARSGRFDTIVVYPHLLFHGRLYQAIVKQTDEAATEFPAVQFVCGGYLGPDPLVANAIADRIRAERS
jgi:sirohydrochlorin cobaltochelatase